ncbi:MAG: ribosome-recycling factor [Patescibacteria group bacterium]
MSYDLTKFREKSKKTLDYIQAKLGKLRTSKATVQLLDPVKVEAYGTNLAVQELATITVSDSTLLLVKPYDKSQLEAIEKAIQTAGLNLNPIVSQDHIKIAVPALTQERREEMVKILHSRLEEGRVLLRSIRTDSKKEIEAQKGESGIGEDDIKRDLVNLDDELKKLMNELEVLAKNKEKDLMTI